MKGLLMLAFFLIFAAASLLIPIPMFPGSWFCAIIGEGALYYLHFLSAVFNGLFYGIILWLLFIGIGRKFEE